MSPLSSVCLFVHYPAPSPPHPPQPPPHSISAVSLQHFLFPPSLPSLSFFALRLSLSPPSSLKPILSILPRPYSYLRPLSSPNFPCSSSITHCFTTPGIAAHPLQIIAES
eukprot:749800-Hanusia_phi.AAC.1